MKLSWLFETYLRYDLNGHLYLLRQPLRTSNKGLEMAVKESAYFPRQSDPRLPDDADNEGDEVDDEAVD